MMRSPLCSTRAATFNGTIAIPGDKSISHRALMIGASAVGETVITGLLEGEDVLRTAAAMRALGADIVRDSPGHWRVAGRGVGGLVEARDVLDMGNAGTGARLLMGLLASHPFTSVFTGDESLRSRPMRRVIEPLSRVGARFMSRSEARLPLAMTGTRNPVPILYELPVASAQVKSAVLLAGLNTPGETVVIEPTPSRDHTEVILRGFGADVQVESMANGGRAITLRGQPELIGRPVTVPGDPSSAAFPAVAALIVPGAEVTMPDIGVNPLRFGLYEILIEMGARIELTRHRQQAGESIADITVRFSDLVGIDVPPELAPSMIDEYPILAVAAAFARGRTRMFGLSELRLKESDRLRAITDGLSACGVRAEVDGDTLIVYGTNGPPAGGVMITANLDHRIAMSFLVLGLASVAPVTVDDAASIATSFPDFVALMNDCGARIESPRNTFPRVGP